MNVDPQQASCSRKPSSSSIMSSGGNDPPMLRPEEEEAENQHVQKIITALRYYRKYSYTHVNKNESYLNSLPKRHQDMLSKYRNHLSVIRDCIDQNQAVINKMLRENILCANVGTGTGTGTGNGNVNAGIGSVDPFNITQHDIDGHAVKIRHMENTYLPQPSRHADVEPFKILKAQSTLKLIARDWSATCAEEREQSYKPIIDAIEEFYKPGEFALNEVKILVPGAGLGRLSYELACRGYECEGNEFSYFMLIASNFVLNQCTEENKYTLYPWVHQNVNNLYMADQVAPVRFPDVCPAKNPPKGNIMMAAGDFLEVYRMPNCYDCVATCFFIDCANNIVDFIETIYRILVPGGIWVNLGPLLYHYSDIPGENSIEPTYENLVLVIEMVGFEILRNKTGVLTKYAQNPKSMLKSAYESLFWICRKPLNADVNNSTEINTQSDRDEDDSVFRVDGSGLSNEHNHYTNSAPYRNGFNNNSNTTQ